jgi:Uma2 family endonuclease
MGIDIETKPRLIRLEPVSWETFLGLLRDLGDHRWRVTYDSGVLELMSPYREHEALKKLIARLIEALTLELDIDIKAGGSTTYKRPDLGKAAEPDECYYIASEPLIRGNREADLSREPPPDLVVEVDIGASSSRRMRIYSAMGVPEVWRHDGERLTAYRLREDGTYRRVKRSVVLPKMPIEEASRLLARWDEESDTAIVRAFLDLFRGRGTRRP